MNFPRVLDSTMLMAFRACPEQFRREYIEHLRPIAPSVHLHAGGAFASGIEAARKAFYLENASAEGALAAGEQALRQHYGDFEPPVGSPKTKERMVGALQFYLANYPLMRDNGHPITLANGKLAVECNFAVPLDTHHPESGEPLLYCGRVDAALQWDGMVLVTDEKTTSQLGDKWASRFSLRNQFQGYVYGMRTFGIEARGVLVRGVAILDESRSKDPKRAAAKKLYDTQHTIIFFAPWMIERWKLQLEMTARRMVAAYKSNEWELNLGDSCTAFGGCAFQTLCLAREPEGYIDGQYRRSEWLPLTRQEESL